MYLDFLILIINYFLKAKNTDKYSNDEIIGSKIILQISILIKVWKSKSRFFYFFESVIFSQISSLNHQLLFLDDNGKGTYKCIIPYQIVIFSEHEIKLLYDSLLFAFLYLDHHIESIK